MPTPTPIRVLLTSPIPGYAPEAEYRPAKKSESVWFEGKVLSIPADSIDEHLVLTPIPRIEDLLPTLKCEAWAAQDEN